MKFSWFLGGILSMGLGLTQTPEAFVYGKGNVGSGDLRACFFSRGVPSLGSNLELVCANLQKSSPGVMLLSTGKASIGLGNFTLLVNATMSFPLSWVSAKENRAEFCEARFSVPVSAGMLGSKVFVQTFFFDSGAPGGWVASQGIGLGFGNAPAEYTCVYDLNAYKKYFAGVTSQTQADALGRKIWNAHKVQGFSYVKTEYFDLVKDPKKGKGFWIVIVKHAKIGLEFSLIPAGDFVQGCDNVRLYEKWVKPLRRVRIWKPLLVSRFEVTQGLWKKIMGSEPWKGKRYAKSNDKYAASYISWLKAKEFCKKAGLRLPTESEWEWAARAGCLDPNEWFYFGRNKMLAFEFDKFGWFAHNCQGANKYAHEVGKWKPNPFGLYDVLGNIGEFCADTPLYRKGGYNVPWTYKKYPTDGSAFLERAKDKLPLRGGSWRTCSVHASFQCRELGDTSGVFDTGLRPVCDLR